MPVQYDAEMMSTGQADIDQQHQEWIRAFNEFERIVQEGKGTDALRGALNFFAQYAEKHFALEEARMTKLSCPAAEANRMAHTSFRQMISVLQRQVQQKESSPDQVTALELELANWLVDHICAVDIELRSC